MIGAIVLSTQASERYLKLILPFTDTRDPSVGAALARHEKLKRRTLGELVGKFVDTATSKSEHFQQDLAKLVDDRNMVVHHFSETFGEQLRAGDAAIVISSLRIMRANARSFELVIERTALGLVEGLRDTTFRGTSEFEDFAALCSEFRERIGANIPTLE